MFPVRFNIDYSIQVCTGIKTWIFYHAMENSIGFLMPEQFKQYVS